MTAIDPRPARPSETDERERLQVQALRDIERMLAVAEIVFERLPTTKANVLSLSSMEDDAMYRTAECVQFARAQLEDVVGGLRRASDRIRDDLKIARRYP